MGWFEGTAKYFDKHGQVDRKKCMRAEFSDESCILKDAIVGSTYYAATRLADGNVSKPRWAHLGKGEVLLRL